MVKEQVKVGVIGSGSWATAMIKMLGDNSNPKTLYWWIRRAEDISYIRAYRHNPTYLSAVEVKLKDENLLNSARAVIQASDVVILNTPSAYLKDALAEVTAADLKDKIIVSAIKGIVPGENLIVGEYLSKVYQVPVEQVVVVAGPCHAEEVSLEKLSYLTIASKNKDHALKVAQLLENRYIKTVLSSDVYGVEYAAVLKNIYALAGGICHGLGYGDNFQAVLISNAIREMERFVVSIDPEQVREINNSGYLGDLLVTAYSQFSRNRTFGNMIGKGYTVQSAQLEMNMIAEGYYASASIQTIIDQYKVEMPICSTVYDILYGHKPVAAAVQKLTNLLT